ncbi:MAG: hypothetical protein A3A24_03040 [Candidatus Buchananbacteria bacterium RIFCSPLOWO2_01_FULL_46_12]|uniref:Uncharacterized protein n=1 Tax=Candidatus Buchananbacteria bacterium RIFCSPLOWO2_01_FULL_46_12 TaxID=1797546 RepID=A0A1G1YMQ0_9BACT|nr:MAG: hypothetical protein A3A24_03040 [Candidatus Buchananbacteria bacterium RIFCSPLOWO2_01_FULL_46_12]
MELSQGIKKLIEQHKLWKQEAEPKQGDTTIAVDEVAARVASFYEKIRGVVDWREEHLLRKTAIERILKRRVFTRNQGEDFAEPFLQELIRGGHFPNNTIPARKIPEIQQIIAKYLFLLEHAPQDASSRILARLHDWLLGIAAAEIEETLISSRRERALIDFMTESVEQDIVMKNGTALSAEDKHIQVYVAVQRALFKLDDATISYHLFEKLYPFWQNQDQETLGAIAEKIRVLQEKIRGILAHPLAEKLYQLAERYDTPYLLVGDIIMENPDNFFELAQDPIKLEAAMKEAYIVRLGKLRGKMHRAALYGTISVFLSKMLIAFAAEVPFDKYVTHEFNARAIGISVVVPPLLMLLLVTSISTSSEENFQKVMLEVMRVTYATDKRNIHELASPKKKGVIMNAVIYAMYLASFILSFGFLYLILKSFQFSALSSIVFLLFISLITFGGTRIRQRGAELLIGEQKQGFLYSIFDFFTLPLIEVGRWLSRQVARYNILVVLLNFLIEIPFQIFVEFIEHWRSFLKEKKEEVH